MGELFVWYKAGIIITPKLGSFVIKTPDIWTIVFCSDIYNLYNRNRNHVNELGLASYQVLV
jgi:hypothetical protein